LFTASDVNVPDGIPFHSDNFFWQFRTADSMIRPLTLINFPQFSTLLNVAMMIGHTYERAWSKIMVGAYMVSSEVGDFRMPNYLASSAVRYYMALCARSIVLPYQNFYRAFSVTPNILNSVFNQIDLEELRQFLTGLFTMGGGSTSSMRMNPAILGDWLRASYEAQLGWDTDTLAGTYSLFESRVFNVIIDRYRTATNNNLDIFLDNCVMQILPDYMYQKAINVKGSCPRAFSPFPSGFKPGSLEGIIPDDWKQFIIGTTNFYSTWVPLKHYVNSITLDDIYEVTDEEVWNERLIYHAFDCNMQLILRDSAGVVVPQVPAPQQVLCTYTTRPNQLAPNQVFTTVPSACTTWIPKFDVNGTVYWLCWPRNQVLVAKYLLGATIPSISTWQVGKTRVNASVLQVARNQSTASSILNRHRRTGTSGGDIHITIDNPIVEN